MPGGHSHRDFSVWQITACDAACSYGVAWLLPAHTAAAAAHFLRRVLLPVYRRAGWRLRRVLTDGGPEFRAAFDEACRALGLRHTRTKPRHAWTNGFVERLQGTILQEHWRVAFRRRYFTSRPALQRSLEVFMQSYNHERPHARDALLGRRSAMTSDRTLGWSRYLHHSGSGHPSEYWYFVPPFNAPSPF